MKTIGLVILVLGFLVLTAGSGYSLFLIDQRSRPAYQCTDYYHTKAEKAEEAFRAAKGSPREKELEKEFEQRVSDEQLYILACSRKQDFFKTRITLGFLAAAGGFVISLVGLGVFLFGRKKTETIE